MAKATTKLNAQDRVILFCGATGIDQTAAGILAQRCSRWPSGGSSRIIAKSGAYALTDSRRATLMAILEDAGLK
jgi:hypothetical protein